MAKLIEFQSPVTSSGVTATFAVDADSVSLVMCMDGQEADPEGSGTRPCGMALITLKSGKEFAVLDNDKNAIGRINEARS